MLTFIKVNGAYIGFWLVMGGVFLVGEYWVVRWAMIDAIRIATK